MECPHLEVGAEVEAAARAGAGGGKCGGCEATQGLWLCLTCGALNCGRYVAGHAKTHHDATGHSTALDWTELSVFCYQCDEFAVNEDARLAAVRAAKSAPTPRRSLRPRKPTKRSPTGRQEENEEEELETATKRPKEVRVVGLRNLGNTCFMNAVLQSLSNIQEFCGYIKKLPALEAKDGRGRPTFRNLRYDESDSLMTEELRKVLVSLDSGDKAAISPESLFSVIWKVVPRFRGYQQQDAHEFLRYMLDRLHTELLTLLPNEPANHSMVTSVFGGTLQSEVHCLTCGTDSKKHDPFLDLSLDVPDRFLPGRTKSKENNEDLTTASCHLEDCLKSFVEVEELAESELYYCSSCKSKQRSTKRFWVRRLPNVLCLHIKRFRWSFCSRTKLDTYISFPLRSLDMSQFVLGQSDSHLYDLAAVIVHHGSGAGSGHYTAFAVNKGHWFHFNDSTVRTVAAKEVEKCKAYILFYIRQEFRLPQF